MSADTPLVSIVIPCYNDEAWVADAIESALAQTWPELEVIVIDDGSTDGSVRVIESFSDRIRWETGPNRGGGAARNRGLAMARGEFVQFLDADDLIKPDKTRRQMDAMPTDSGWMVLSGVEAIDTTGRPTSGTWIPAETIGDPVDYVLRNSLMITPLHSRSDLLAAGCFREHLKCSQERDLHLRLACGGIRFASVPEPLYVQRKRADSVSSDSLAVLHRHEDVFLNAEDLLRSSERLTDSRRRTLAFAWARDGRDLVVRGDCESARRYFARALALDAAGAAEAFAGLSSVLYRLLGPLDAQRLVAAKRRLVRQWK